MENEQIKIETEAIPLLSLPLPPTLDSPRDSRSSIDMYEETPSVEVKTECETKQQMEGAGENLPQKPTPRTNLTNQERKTLMRRNCVLLCLQKFVHVEKQLKKLNHRRINKLYSILIQEGEESLNHYFINRYRDLRMAVKLRDVQSIKHHIAAGASLIFPLREGGKVSILNCCIEEYCCRSVQHKRPQNYCLPVEREIIQEILAAAEKAENKSDIMNYLDKYGRSALYLAIDCGYFELVQTLIKCGANVDNVSDKKETVLHVAVQRPDILKYFLDHHNIENSDDTRGYAAIHAAVKFDEVDSFNLLINKFGVTQLESRTYNGSTALHVAAENGATKLADILIQNFEDLISRADHNEETALNRSAKHGHKTVTASLLRNGAVLSDIGKEKRTAVEQIIRKFPDTLKFFEDVFDEFITENDSSDMCKESKVHVDYKVLTDNDYYSMSQIKVIEELVRCGQSEVLLHPLIESLLYLKWKCLLPVFYTIIAIYAFFLVSFNAFVVTTFHRRDYNADNCSNSFNETNAQCHKCFDVYDWIWIVQIYFSIFLLLGQECVYICLQRRRYFDHLESWVKLCLLALASVVPPGVICGEPADWLRHVSCAALLLSWLQAMFLFSRFPDWGYYVLMFERVAYNIFKILLTSICLVIGFSFCFMIQYRSESPFDGPQAAFAKTLVMMSSEFDYEGLFAEEHNAALEHTRSLVRLLFVIFVIFIAIVLMNFMIGIAVSDINELNKIGNIRRLEKQVELQSTLDVLVDTVLLKLFKRLSRIKFHHNISKDIESDAKWKVCYGVDSLKTDEYEQCLTSDLQEAIINVAKRKAQRNKDNHNKNKKENRLDVMYDTLMKLPPYLERDKQEGDARALDEKMFYKNTETSILLMQNKITSLEISNKDMKISMNELKENMNKLLAIMSGEKDVHKSALE